MPRHHNYLGFCQLAMTLASYSQTVNFDFSPIVNELQILAGQSGQMKQKNI